MLRSFSNFFSSVFSSNVHATDGDDKTCLHYASQSKTMLAQSVVSCLIDQGSEMGKHYTVKLPT